MLLHETPDFTDLLSVVSREQSINPGLVEKDYWIMPVSQAVFSRPLNISKNLVSDWERGTNRPVLRLVIVIDRKRKSVTAIM